MTRRLLPLAIGWLLSALLLAAAFSPLPARAAEVVEITAANIESTEEGYRLATKFSFDLTRGLEDVITRGIPLYFTTEVELTRPRWYWFDEKAISASRTIRISYDVLTRQYHASASGRLQQSFVTLEDALSLVRRPSRWLIADKGALKPGEVYNVAVRMGLDVARLPKPFQVHAINSSDWRLSSDWKTFTFRAE
ncbi:DUF4390 domain-containing protein [Noviherbaspirillum cavernae]|uniref:DUF4390 domain-containing protein n=1 Tax=Noviherbaspirillum cavernae TaxID=2320862 RepID=UPI001F5B2159|nr:DUF4390 domain-containing protein [Noviherbaspirillum cavernae]